MSKKILLINPWVHDFAAYDFWLKPLGLLYLEENRGRTSKYKIRFKNKHAGSIYLRNWHVL